MDHRNVVTIDGRRTIFGLSWRVIDQLGSRNDVIKQMKRDGARWQASYKTARYLENLGTMRSAPPKGRVLSAAGQAALHPNIRGTTALIVLEEEGSQVAQGLVGIIGLQSGNVTMDVLVSPADAPATIRAYTDRLAKTEESFRVHGTIQTPQIQQAVSRAEGQFPFTWHDLIPPQRGLRGFFGRSTPSVYLRPLKTDQALKYTAIASVSVAVIAAGLYANDVLQERDEAARAFAAKQKQDPRHLYQESIKQFLATPRILLRDAIPAVRTSIGPVNVQMAGWKLKTISCNSSSCSATWERDFGTFDEFISRAPEAWLPVVPDENLSRLTHTFPLEMPKRTLPDRKAWLTQTAFLQSEASRWQRLKELGLSITLQKPELRALPSVASASVQSQAIYAAVPEAIRGSTWNISKTDWLLSKAFENAPESMSLEQLTISFTGKGVQFDASGVSYVSK
ncbi:hypothetical protein LMG19282_01468 [Cupriavidus campinensis]|uniref:Type 4b pilus protein PilO2 n=1 Tax=Cupriavidus campinensis TaxID=151783 RepID=A0ABY3EJ97_9BURK|nr:type 4b pilus protein PilO2 [Cupriavidus campinensis]TSP11005.1 hypothetical protein FGG12_19265 [Cupriavidus campinensis]CAG2138248.1 hypothetical protein LMG19282_01468 [Cupriavidus campinensis]